MTDQPTCTACRLPYLPAEVISNILEFCIACNPRREDPTTFWPRPIVNLNAHISRKDPRGHEDPDYTALKQAQSELTAFMTVSKTWYYAAKPSVYRCPVITTPEALESFSQTISSRADLNHSVRSFYCVPFFTTFGQPPRKTFPQTQARANIRLEYGSYAALLRTLKHCSRIETLGIRFVDLSTILTLAHFLNTPTTSTTLRSLSVCGNCFDARYRRRLELGRIMTSHLHLPNLEELWLDNFFISPRYVFSWPAFPALRKFSLLKTWITKSDVQIIPTNLPKLVDLTLGVSGPSPTRTIQSIAHLTHQLERFHIVGSSVWRDTQLTLASLKKLRVLVLSSTTCAFSPPGVLSLPPALELISIERGANLRTSDAEWINMLHCVMHNSQPPALKRILIAGLAQDDDKFRTCVEGGCFVKTTGRVLEVDTSGVLHYFKLLSSLMLTHDPGVFEQYAPHKKDWYWF